MTKQTQPFTLGQPVSVCAHVWTAWADMHTHGDADIVHQPAGRMSDSKRLLRQTFIEPVRGIIVGYTWRATGRVDIDDDGWPIVRYLIEDKRHKVWLIATGLRYVEPIVALEEDIEEAT